MKRTFSSISKTKGITKFVGGGNDGILITIVFYWNIQYPQFSVDIKFSFGGHFMWRWGNFGDGGYIGRPYSINHCSPTYSQGQLDIDVQGQYWHATKDKFHDLPTYFTIKRASVVPNVVVVHNKKEVFQLKEALTQRF
jgi:hypothetical protein